MTIVRLIKFCECRQRSKIKPQENSEFASKALKDNERTRSWSATAARVAHVEIVPSKARSRFLNLN